MTCGDFVIPWKNTFSVRLGVFRDKVPPVNYQMNNKDKKLDSDAVKSLRELGKKSLFFLARGILEFGDLDREIHKPICDTLQDYEKNTKVLVVLPRDWFKSTIGSVAYPIWRAINDPNIRILVVQNSHSNACKKLQAIKQIFEKNDLFRALYPDILPNKSCRWSSECLTVNRTAAHPEGTFEAAGTGTAVTSRHYDLIIEDDTVAPEKDSLKGIVQQPTQLEIEKAIGWHRVAMPLQIHPTKSQRIVIGTRWADRDLIGWIMKNEPDYMLMMRKAIENGKAVWERFDDNVLKQLTKTLGPYMMALLYLNEATSSINQVFQREWIQYYDVLGKMDTKKLVYCTSVDPAASDTDGSSDPDYNIVLTTGINPLTGRVYVMEYTRARMNPGELIAAILKHQGTYHPVVVKIEAIAYQRSINYWLKRTREKLQRRFYVEEIKSWGRTSKLDRIRALQPYFADGIISIRAHMAELERELLSFPNGAHDDILDALCMQIQFWNNETKMKKAEEDKSTKADPFSGASIIDELIDISNELHRYPNDIGHMKERIAGRQRREYQYA